MHSITRRRSHFLVPETGESRQSPPAPAEIPIVSNTATWYDSRIRVPKFRLLGASTAHQLQCPSAEYCQVHRHRGGHRQLAVHAGNPLPHGRDSAAASDACRERHGHIGGAVRFIVRAAWDASSQQPY